MLFGANGVLGCEKAAPPVTDPVTAPWLFDPKSQIGLLTNSESLIRGQAATNLGNMGAAAAEALPALEKVAKNDADPEVREKARAAAEKIRAATGASVQPNSAPVGNARSIAKHLDSHFSWRFSNASHHQSCFLDGTVVSFVAKRGSKGTVG
jgi:hypothetical protein